LSRRALLATLLSGGLTHPALVRPARGRPAVADGPVVASFSVLGDMVRQVAGDRAPVRVIAGPETDAHGFQPRPSDAQAIQGATLLVRNGLGFDPWFDRLARAAATARTPMVTATEGIPTRTIAGHHHHHGGVERGQQHSVPARRVADPHAWQDVGLARLYVRNIAAGLAQVQPDAAPAHQAAAAAYDARLAALDQWVRQQVASVPVDRRKVITAHDAFGYFGEAYGITFLAPQGVSSAAEPSAAEVARLIRQIRAEGITAVFVEAATAPATVERLAQEAGVRVRGRLFADTLSAPAGPAPTYEAMLRHNVGLLVPAMRGDA
jgi:zinc/manganese transport system substrate-binding protein